MAFQLMPGVLVFIGPLAMCRKLADLSIGIQVPGASFRESCGEREEENRSITGWGGEGVGD